MPLQQTFPLLQLQLIAQHFTSLSTLTNHSATDAPDSAVVASLTLSEQQDQDGTTANSPTLTTLAAQKPLVLPAALSARFPTDTSIMTRSVLPTKQRTAWGPDDLRHKRKGQPCLC